MITLRWVWIAAAGMIVTYRVAAQGVAVYDTVYTPPGYVDGNLSATMFIPENRNGNAVILVHGLGGSPLNNRIWCDTLAAHGYVAMSIRYPDPGVSASAVFPKKTRAAKTAVEFLRANAARFGLTKGGIAGWGMSLGAQTWGEAVTWDNDDAYFGTDPNVNDRLDAVIMLYGRYDRYNYPFWQNYFSNDPAKMAKGRCVGNISRITTPVLFLHGTADATTPYQEVQLVHDSLTSYGKSSQLRFFQNEPHAFDVLLRQLSNGDYDGYAFTPAGLVAKDTVLAFLARVFSRSSPSGVTIIDTTYTPPGYPDSLRATIFVPDPATAKGVGIVLSHGLTASRLGHRVWCDTLAARGYVAMTIDFPDIDKPGGRYPMPVRNFKTAVQFLRRNADRFGIRNGKVVAWGQSQGSLIWGQTITWDNDHGYFNTDSTINDHLDAAILLYGIYDMNGPVPAWASPIITTYFSQDPSLRSTKGNTIANAANVTTPVLLLHATGDPVAYAQHSRMLHDSLKFFARRSTFVEFASTDHVFDQASETQFTPLGLAAKDTVLAFLSSLTTTTVDLQAGNFPDHVDLLQNYPNPFNPATTIRFQLPTSGNMRLAVYDLLGREVAVLVNERKAAGSFDVRFEASGLASGIYMYRLTAGSSVQTRRMLLLK